MNAKVKVFIMAVIGFIVTAFSVMGNFNLWYLLIVTVAFALEYAAKNFFFPSTSPTGQVMWKDLLSGLILAVCMALNVFGANLLLGIEFSAHALWVAVVGAVVGYFTKTVSQGQKA